MTSAISNQFISTTGFESPCSTKGKSCRFSPLETPLALCPPQEAGFTLNQVISTTRFGIPVVDQREELPLLPVGKPIGNVPEASRGGLPVIMSTGGRG